MKELWNLIALFNLIFYIDTSYYAWLKAGYSLGRVMLIITIASIINIVTINFFIKNGWIFIKKRKKQWADKITSDIMEFFGENVYWAIAFCAFIPFVPFVRENALFISQSLKLKYGIYVILLADFLKILILGPIFYYWVKY